MHFLDALLLATGCKSNHPQTNASEAFSGNDITWNEHLRRTLVVTLVHYESDFCK